MQAVVSDAMGAGQKIDEEALGITTARMVERLGLMPRFLGVPMASATVVFDLAGWVHAGRPFRRQGVDAQHKQMETWRNAPIGFFRDFLDFWEKMGVFVYFSTVEEKEGKEHRP